MTSDHDEDTAADTVQDQTTNWDGSVSVEYGDGSTERFETEADPSGEDEQQDQAEPEMIDGQIYEY